MITIQYFPSKYLIDSDSRRFKKGSPVFELETTFLKNKKFLGQKKNMMLRDPIPPYKDNAMILK